MLKLDFSVFPDLRTDRLVLREVTAADAPALFALRTDERVMRHLARPRASTERDAADLIEQIAEGRSNGTGITWGISLVEAPELIGTIGFYRLRPEHYTAEVGYLLSPDQWRKGLMKEALTAVTAHGFGLGFWRIEAITDPDNGASRGLLERSGYRYEGTLRGNLHWQGKQLDSAVYARLASD